MCIKNHKLKGKEDCTSGHLKIATKKNIKNGHIFLIVWTANVLTATLWSYITETLIFTNFEVVFISKGYYNFLNLHKIMRTPTFFRDLIHSQRMFGYCSLFNGSCKFIYIFDHSYLLNIIIHHVNFNSI